VSNICIKSSKKGIVINIKNFIPKDVITFTMELFYLACCDLTCHLSATYQLLHTIRNIGREGVREKGL